MRFNELIAGVRGDVAVKVFGDDFASMNRTAEQIASVLRKTAGATDVKVEQTTGASRWSSACPKRNVPTLARRPKC